MSSTRYQQVYPSTHDQLDASSADRKEDLKQPIGAAWTTTYQANAEKEVASALEILQPLIDAFFDKHRQVVSQHMKTRSKLTYRIDFETANQHSLVWRIGNSHHALLLSRLNQHLREKHHVRLNTIYLDLDDCCWCRCCLPSFLQPTTDFCIVIEQCKR